MKTYCFGLYLLLLVIYPLQTDQIRSSDNSATPCFTFTLHDLRYNPPNPGIVERACPVDRNGQLWEDKYWADSFLQRFLKCCLTFLAPLYKKEFPCWYILLMQTSFPHMES